MSITAETKRRRPLPEATKEKIRRANTKHGGKGTTLYHIWKGIRYRCNSPGSHAYHNYGERGIKLCKEWDDFSAFRKWAENNGYKDGLTIERKSVNGPYSPDNCTWIPLAQQARNRRNTLWVDYQGKRLPMSELAEVAGINYHTLYTRIVIYSWSVERAVDTPIKIGRPYGR